MATPGQADLPVSCVQVNPLSSKFTPTTWIISFRHYSLTFITTQSMPTWAIWNHKLAERWRMLRKAYRWFTRRRNGVTSTWLCRPWYMIWHAFWNHMPCFGNKKAMTRQSGGSNTPPAKRTTFGIGGMHDTVLSTPTRNDLCGNIQFASPPIWSIMYPKQPRDSSPISAFQCKRVEVNKVRLWCACRPLKPTSTCLRIFGTMYLAGRIMEKRSSMSFVICALLCWPSFKPVNALLICVVCELCMQHSFTNDANMLTVKSCNCSS